MKRMRIATLCAVLGLAHGTVVQADDAVQLPPDDKENPWEIHGVLKNESALFTRSGQTTNQASSTTDTTRHHAGDLLKVENSLNLFVNRQFTDSTSMHSQLNLMYETEGMEGDRGHRSYSQNDYLRELYLDTTLSSWDLRLGKQQEVWGTADGIKLLDILNPTDYREFVQNTMSDSRIPVWMMKASTSMGGTGNLQLLLAQPKDNYIPGLEASGGPGEAFIMKGVDAITGRVNGFLNITPALGQVAGTFDGMAKGFGLPGLVVVPNAFGPGVDFNPRTMTVQNFVNGTTPMNGACPAGLVGAACLNQFTQMTNKNQTLLMDGANWNPNNPHSAFEYMNNATFATFNTFVGARSTFRQDYPDDLNLNVGFRYKNSIGGNFNYSLNYLNHYDPNPYVDLSWENGQGSPLTTERVVNGGVTTLNLKDATGKYYGAVDPNTLAAINRPATLVFTEKMKRINSLGGSFDTSVESGLLGPVVLRGEAVYQMGVQTPVVDRDLLSQGDLVGGMQSQNTEMLKYVLGAEFIAFTNLTIGGQFI